MVWSLHSFVGRQRWNASGRELKWSQGESASVFFATFSVKTILTGVSSGSSQTHSSKESRASFFSTILFLWLVPLIFTGYRRPLVAKDLEDLKRDYEAKSSFNTLSNALYGPEQESSPQALVSRSETFSSTRKGDAFELDDLPTHHPASEPQHFHQSSPTSKKPQRPLMVATLFAFPIQIIVRPVAWRLLFTAASLCQVSFRDFLRNKIREEELRI